MLTRDKKLLLRHVNQQTARPKMTRTMITWTKKAGSVNSSLIIHSTMKDVNALSSGRNIVEM